MTVMTTGDAIVESLIAHGIDTVFGIPGAHMYDFNDALARRTDAIRFITARHEQGAAYMAFGYAKSTGRVGVYTVVPGPGARCAEFRGGALYRLRRDRSGPLHHRQHHVAPDRTRPRTTARAARSAGPAARPHQVGGAHRPSGTGALRHGRGLPPACLRTRAAGRRRGALGCVRSESGRGAAAANVAHPGAPARPGLDRKSRRAH